MIGGQALIEGILMRGPTKESIVCRTADGLVEKVDDLKLIKDKYPALGWPLIRGVITFLDSMIRGMKALTYSAGLLPEEEQEAPTKFDIWLENKFGNEKAQKFIIGFAVILGLALAVFLFVFLPTFLIGLVPHITGRIELRSLLEGILKLAIFFLYLWLCSKMKDVRRLFSYHGAEHKTIFCYEKGQPLTVENVRPQSRFHPRCGTSFLFVVIILGVLLGFFIHVENTFARIGLRLLLLPVLVSLAYELNRWVGRHDDNPVARVLSAPGRWIQRLTTNEPDDDMIECAIRALILVIPEEKGKDAW
ncbi:MAG: DUF1385 domain-containing protein [Clostridia bacterium]|nr:DUF1385 domain-containing protein [Clostridia bacterium]